MLKLFVVLILCAVIIVPRKRKDIRVLLESRWLGPVIIK